jgi:uncharacterized iron-regulated protein
MHTTSLHVHPLSEKQNKVMCISTLLRFFVVQIFLLLSLAGCGVVQGALPPLHYENHPLANTIWEVSSGRNLSLDEMMELSEAQDFVLLGEKHDNPFHHVLHARFIESMVKKQRHTIALEHLDERDAPLLASLHHYPLSAWEEGFQWGERGWDSWVSMKPIFEVIAAHKLFVIPARISPPLLRSIMTGGFEGPRATTIRNIINSVRLSPEVESEMSNQIKAAHCNYLPDHALPQVVETQRAWDSAMAAALQDSRNRVGDSVILIAGTEHARTDRGVPLYLKYLEPQKKTISIGFLEVSREIRSFQAAAQEYGRGMLPFDIVYFTPTFDISDPCRKFLREV